MPTENAMATDEPTRTRGLWVVWYHPWGRSKNGERAAIDGKRNEERVRSEKQPFEQKLYGSVANKTASFISPNRRPPSHDRPSVG